MGKTNAAEHLRRRANMQLAMLSATFLLGMGVNLIGLPSETNGGSHAATLALLIVHIGIGIGLVVGGILAIRLSRALGGTKLAWGGLAAVVVAFASGILTMATKSNWWSYLMAVSFIGGFWAYGTILVRAKS